VRRRRSRGVALDQPRSRRPDAPRGGRPRHERADPTRAGARLVIAAGALVVTVVVGIPALVFVLWPLFGRTQRGRTFLPLPLDRRQELDEDKRVALGAIRELEFEHTAGPVPDADFTAPRARSQAG